jgi:adenylate cyclase
MIEQLEKLNKELEKENLPKIDIGIGLNTDDMVVGNMGSNKRFDYTVMGDGVNLGSRLEGLNKQYGTHIIISEFTYALVKKEYLCRKLDFVKVKGKDKVITIYELIDHQEYVSKAIKEKALEFEKALDLYKEGKFKEAKKIFEKLEDSASKLFSERCEEFIKNPPKKWEGVWVMKTK